MIFNNFDRVQTFSADKRTENYILKDILLTTKLFPIINLLCIVVWFYYILIF